MKIVLSLVCLVVVAIWVLKRLRKKEQDKFLESNAEDRVLLEKIRLGSDTLGEKKQEQDDPILLRAQAYMSRNSASPIIKAQAPISIAPLRKAPSLQLKKVVLGERHRNLLQVLEKAFAHKYRIFVHLPLVDFLVGPAEHLAGKRIAYLICDPLHFQVVAGLELQNAESLEEVFKEINLPLITLPKLASYTEEIIKTEITKQNYAFLIKG